MPPFLRDGKPLNRHDPDRPARGHLCVCTECLPLTTWDPVRKRTVHGQYLSQKMLKEHRRMDTMREAASYLPTVSVGHVEIPPSSRSLDGHASQSAPEASRSGLQCRDNSERVASQLDKIEADFSRMRASANERIPSDLVFIHPPTSSSIPIMLQPPQAEVEINTGRFALDHQMTENADILAYETQLLEHILAIERLGKIRADVLHQRAKDLIRDLEEELDKSERLKMGIWERQRIETISGKSTSKMQLPAIDCGMYMRNDLFIVLTSREEINT